MKTIQQIAGLLLAGAASLCQAAAPTANAAARATDFGVDATTMRKPAALDAPLHLYTALTAPDAVSRDILSHTLKTLNEGMPAGGDFGYYLHRNYTQLIEQNVAERDAAGAAQLVDNLTDKEWHDLAQLYVNAAVDGGHDARVLEVFAQRLDGARLGRLAKFFGYAPMYQAVGRAAPAKTADFTAHASADYAGPVYGAGVSTMGSPSGIGKFLNMTPSEIYSTFRSAEYGSLGVTGALFETGVILYGTLDLIAYQAGQSAGTSLANLIQTYDMPLWDTIGSVEGQMMENVETAGTQLLQGNAEEAAGTLFDVTPPQAHGMSTVNGDFGTTGSWTVVYMTTLGGTNPTPPKNQK